MPHVLSTCVFASMCLVTFYTRPTGRRCQRDGGAQRVVPPDVQCDGEVWGQRCVCLYSPQWHGDPGGQRHRQSHCAMWVCGNSIGLVVLVSPLFHFIVGVGGGGGCIVWMSAWIHERGCKCVRSLWACLFVKGRWWYALVYSHDNKRKLQKCATVSSWT